MIDPHFQNYLHELGFVTQLIRENFYLGIFFLSIFISYTIPFPEAILLIFFGYLAKMMGFDVGYVILVSFAGAIIGDNAMYRLSYFGNKYVESFNQKMRANKLIKYEHLVVNNIGKTIYFLRLINGLRFLGPVVSGTLGVRWRKFLPLNFGATLLHTTFFVTLGYMYHHRVFLMMTEVEIVKTTLLFSSVFIVGILISIFLKKEKKKETN